VAIAGSAVSAIVVSYRTGPVLDACLAALRAADGVGQIAVVDNGNPPEGEAQIDAHASADPRVRVVRGHGNIGFAAGCNKGVAVSACGMLVFVNPDAVLEPDALTGLAAALGASPGLTVVGGDLRDERGRPERGARRRRVTLWRAFVSFTGLSAVLGWLAPFRDVNLHDAPAPAAPVRVGAVSGALLLMRRADFDALGGFDDGYFVHVEDVDLCRRVDEAGGAVLFAPGPHGLHHRSSSEVSRSAIARHKAHSFARYFRKFARNGIERAMTELTLPLVTLALRVRG